MIEVTSLDKSEKLSTASTEVFRVREVFRARGARFLGTEYRVGRSWRGWDGAHETQSETTHAFATEIDMLAWKRELHAELDVERAQYRNGKLRFPS